MSSIERTAYPRFPRLISARELHVFYTPASEEITWAGEVTNSDESLLGLVLALKCFQRMGRFPRDEEIPELVVDHVRRGLGLDAGVSAVYGSDRTRRHHRGLVRKRVGVVHNPARAREVAAGAIREAAVKMNNPPDLINVALETLVSQSLELPGFTTLDEMAAAIRAEVNREIVFGINDRITAMERAALLATLHVWELDNESMFTRMKKPAKRPTWSRFKDHSQYLKEIDALGETGKWVEGWPSRRLLTSPRRPRPKMRARCATTTRSNRWSLWRAWCTPRGRGHAMIWRTCCASGSR